MISSGAGSFAAVRRLGWAMGGVILASTVNCQLLPIFHAGSASSCFCIAPAWFITTPFPRRTWLRGGVPSNWQKPATVAPDWTKDLVMYEIAPKGFTSPNGVSSDGAGSGTFKSLEAKVRDPKNAPTHASRLTPLRIATQVPYLKALGITGVWLAGSA